MVILIKKVYLLLFSLLCLFSFNEIGYAEDRIDLGSLNVQDKNNSIDIRNVLSCTIYDGVEHLVSPVTVKEISGSNRANYTLSCKSEGDVTITCKTNSYTNWSGTHEEFQGYLLHCTSSKVDNEDKTQSNVSDDKNNEEEPTSNVLKNL